MNAVHGSEHSQKEDVQFRTTCHQFWHACQGSALAHTWPVASVRGSRFHSEMCLSTTSLPCNIAVWD